MDIANQQEDEVLFANNSVTVSTRENRQFDEIVAILEDILVDSTFVEMQHRFGKEHCHTFENSSENKLVYTQLFQKYTVMIEGFISKRLSENFENITLETVASMLVDREKEIAGDLIDLLLSFSDFDEFKDMMLSYRNTNKYNDLPKIVFGVTPLENTDKRGFYYNA